MNIYIYILIYIYIIYEINLKNRQVLQLHNNVNYYQSVCGIQVPEPLVHLDFVYSPTGSPGTHSSTANHGQPHSKYDSNWQKTSSSTNPVTLKPSSVENTFTKHHAQV